MAINNLSSFKEQFDGTYEEVLTKSLVGMKIASTRLESKLEEGKTLKRSYTNINNIGMQDLVVNTNYQINNISDASEVITIDQNKAIVFGLDSVDKIQAGSLTPGEFLGSLAAKEVMRYVDGDILAQVKLAAQTFDTGDLTSAGSSGVPIALATSNVVQLLAQAEAKLGYINVRKGGLAFVIDSYGQSPFAQYMVGKQADFTMDVFENGYIGSPTWGADVYVSNNLSADVIVNMTVNPTAGQILKFVAPEGKMFTFTFVAAIGVLPGNVLIGGTVDATRANLVALMNNPSVTTATGVAFTDVADVMPALDYVASSFKRLRVVATNDTPGNNVLMTTVGSGRLVTTTTTTAVITATLNAFFGKKGAIDVVVQDKITAQVVDDPFQFRDIFRSKVLYGVKTFKDGRVGMLWVKINANL